jgi:dihydroorotase
VTILIRRGTVIGLTALRVADVLVRDGRIVDVAERIDAPAGATVIEAEGCWVGPGLVDLHAHLREPGREEAETIESGARAAAMGGYTAIVAMPNTEPALDTVALVSYVLERGARSVVDVAVAGAITQGRRGELLAPMGEMARLGVRLFTDDGDGVQSASVMRRALEYAKPLGVRLAQHCEEASLVEGGSMNEGPLSGRLGLLGRPALAEEVMVLRDLALVRLTGSALHLLHLSTRRSLELVAAARAEGLPVTCEVAPHHFTLDEGACSTYDPTFKVHPPLRSVDDVTAVRDALMGDGCDAVASDHAPHAPELKDLAFDEAPAGMLGLEHAASLTFEALGGADASPHRFFDLLSRAPARIAQLRQADERATLSGHGGEVSVGEDANLVVFDPAVRWRVDARRLQSRARNTPYDGRQLVGRVRATIVQGRLIVNDNELA